jgi:hypothetical protein
MEAGNYRRVRQTSRYISRTVGTSVAIIVVLLVISLIPRLQAEYGAGDFTQQPVNVPSVLLMRECEGPEGKPLCRAREGKSAPSVEFFFNSGKNEFVVIMRGQPLRKMDQRTFRSVYKFFYLPQKKEWTLL